MFRMLIDTCVWLDLARNPRQVPALGVIEVLLRKGMIELIVLQIVLDEFRRNRERVAKDSAKSLSSHFRLVREAVARAGGDDKAARAVGTLDRIEKLLTSAGRGRRRSPPQWRPGRSRRSSPRRRDSARKFRQRGA